MQPLRNLVKKNSKFKWNANLDQIFEDSKQKLVECSIEGIQTYDLAVWLSRMSADGLEQGGYWLPSTATKLHMQSSISTCLL